MNRLLSSAIQASEGLFSLSALGVGLPCEASAAKGGEQWGEISRNQVSRIEPLNRLLSFAVANQRRILLPLRGQEGRGEVPAIFE